MEPFWAFIIAGVTGYLAVEYGGNLWPHEWHLFLQLGLALLIAEFGRYWIHRWAMKCLGCGGFMRYTIVQKTLLSKCRKIPSGGKSLVSNT
jgi:hypothetical protein